MSRNLLSKKYLERSVSQKLGRSFQDVAPSISALVVKKGKIVFEECWGQEYKFYDLASLTKILFTAPAMMELETSAQLQSQDFVSKHIPEWHGEQTLENLMSHTGGLTWWHPFYKELDPQMNEGMRWAKLKDFLLPIQLKAKSVHMPSKAVYSDLDLLVLGLILQQRGSLRSCFERLKQSKNWSDLFFIPIDFSNPSQSAKALGLCAKDFAPTEMCSFRGRVLQGEVHDENTWALGGVSTHAGLFGNPRGVASWLEGARSLILNSRDTQKAWSNISPKIFRKYTRRSFSPSVGDFGHLFMVPSQYKRSCGRFFSPNSFGHLGFTGTSMWFDPKKDLGVILLSNRVNPSRANTLIVKFRPLFHEAVVDRFC